METLIKTLTYAGLTEKAARTYVACLSMGEATIQDIARVSGLKRTSVYYVIRELTESGAAVETKRGKHTYYIAEDPHKLLKNARERISALESELPDLNELKHAAYRKPRLYFLYGPAGFKKIWDMIFSSREKEFLIITEGFNFLDFVREKYILNDIIKRKKKLGVRSRQLITETPYGKKIVAKDALENRLSKLLPSGFRLPFTTVITREFVAFISPRWDDLLFVVENEAFADTHRAHFELLWKHLP